MHLARRLLVFLGLVALLVSTGFSQAVPAGIPQITTAPAPASRSIGVSSTISVVATGDAPLSYQWLKGTATSATVEIPGATGASYTIASPTGADSSYYSVRVSNAKGSITTEPVFVSYSITGGSVASTILPASFSSSSAQVYSVLPESDGGYIVAGNWQTITFPGSAFGEAIPGLARFTLMGEWDFMFPYTTTSSTIFKLVREASGATLIAGFISQLEGNSGTLAQVGIARALATGDLDPAFVGPFPALSSPFVYDVAVESTGSILLAGVFSSVNGLSGTRYLIRINGTTGAVDPTFAPALSVTSVRCIRLLADGSILVGHSSGVAKLNSDGSFASGFVYGGTSAQVNVIFPLTGGDFLIARETSTNPLLRINSAGSLVAFPVGATGPNNAVRSIAQLPSGNLMVGGLFTTYNGSTVNRIAHITQAGAPASGINTGTGFNNTVNTLVTGPDGRLWVGGAFTTYQGTLYRKLVCLGTESVPAVDPGAPTPDAYTQFLINAGIAAARRGTADDPDGDGSTNLQEFQNGTNPADAASLAYRLNLSGIGASVVAVPASVNSAYASGTSVTVTATPDAGLAFIGWADGTSAAASTTNPLTVVMNQERTLTAVAGLPLGASLDAPSNTWTTGGVQLWRGVAAPSTDGVDAVRVSGVSAVGQESWIETTVTGPGVLSFRENLTTAIVGGLTFQVLQNGTPLGSALASGGSWNAYSFNVTASGPLTFRFRVLGAAGVTANDVAMLDRFYFGPFTATTLLPPTNVTQTSVTLNWTEVPATSGYYIEVATNAAFTTGTRAYWCERDILSQNVTGLTAGTLYYWRVSVYGPSGTTQQQATGTFTPAVQQAQTIDFPALSSRTFGDAPFGVAATATSGLPVTFSIVSGPATVAGSTLTLTGAGTVVVRASQAGNAFYLAAPTVDRSFSVAQSAQTITFPQPADFPADATAYHSLVGSTSSGLPLTFTVDSGPASIIDGMLNVTGVGAITLTASQAGDANYLAATSVTRTFNAGSAPAANRLKMTTVEYLVNNGQSLPRAISGDGSTVVGMTTAGTSDNEAFYSNATSLTVGLGDLAGGMLSSEAHGVSFDGSVVVGRATSAAGSEAFRWTAATGLVSISNPAISATAYAVSSDGATIVGTSGAQGFRWTSGTGLVGLGYLPGGSFSAAYGVSGDGSVIVGHADTTGFVQAAFRWTPAGGMTSLGDLPGGDVYSMALAVSADGTTIVGESRSSRGKEAFRWTAATGMVALGDLPGSTFQSVATAVSGDGSVIVGTGYTTNGIEAWVWDAARGMRSVRSLLDVAGLAPGSTINSITGVSADGRFITGTSAKSGSPARAWVIDLNAPAPAPAAVALVWTEDLPQLQPFRAYSVLRLADDTGAASALDIATHLESTTGGFNGVEYVGGKLLVPNQGIGGGGTRWHHPAYSPILVTNVFAYDLDMPVGDLWATNGNPRDVIRYQPSASPVISGGLYDYTFTQLSLTDIGRFALAVQVVGSTVYVSNPANNPVGLYTMNTDGTGLTPLLTSADASSFVIYDFEVVGDYIYFGDIATNQIRRVNTNGTGLVTLVSNAQFPNGIDVTDDSIYWTELFKGRIRRCNLTGGAVTEIRTDLVNPRGVVAGPTSLLTLTPPVTFASYLATAGVPAGQQGNDDDPDGDGISNLLEYALGMNPAGSGGAGYTGSLPVPTATSGTLSYTYVRLRPELTYTVQTSTDLVTWTSIGVDQGTPAVDGTTVATLPYGTAPVYVRLQVTP